jgi:hypothetical protein
MKVFFKTLFFSMICALVHGQAVTGLEYFIDNTDPGNGNAIQVPISQGANITETFNINLTSTTPGLHALNIRARGTGDTWSLTNTIYFFTVKVPSSSITRLEYFIDADPGLGLGQQVAITPGPTVTQSFVVNTSSTSPGIHILSMRVQDSNGAWNVINSVPLFVATGLTENITGIEYFFDTDPGFGNGTAVTSLSPSTTINETFPIDVSSVSPGFHILNIRTRDAGNVWGHTMTLPLFVVTGSAANIVKAEYFFDSDPGFGSGTSVPITAGTNITKAFAVNASSVTPGLHSLRFRTQDANGTWSHTVTHQVIVVKDPGNVTAIEYAIDTDPGPGNATEVLVPPAANTTAGTLIPLGSVAEGSHKLFMRTKDSNGSWSHTVISAFEVCNFPAPSPIVVNATTNRITLSWSPVSGASGYQLDVSKDSFFTFLTGFDNRSLTDTTQLITGLTENTNYQFRVRSVGTCTSGGTEGNVSTYRVTNAADSLVLVQLYNNTSGSNWTNQANWLTGAAASWHGITVNGLGRVMEINLPNNNLAGSIPTNITTLTGLTTIDIAGNNLEQLPNLTSLGILLYLHVENNSFTFEDIEPNVGIPTFTYSPQKQVGTADSIVVATTLPLSILKTVGGTANQYQWQLDNVDVPGETSTNLSRIATLADDGVWKLKITNTIATSLQLFTAPIKVTVVDDALFADSLALVTLYNGTAGAAWITKTNWLAGPITTWFGVTVTSGRVAALSLASNNLTGNIPSGINSLTSLTALNLSGNNIGQLPDLTSMTAITSFNVSNNNLTFEDLEPNVGITGIVYSPQKVIDVGDTTLSLIVGDPMNLTLNVNGTANRYQWQLNTLDVPGDTLNTLSKNATLADNGVWRLKITNSIVPGLDLFSNDIKVKVIYLADSLALVQLYAATNGPAWTNRTNWLTGNLSTWFGVTSSQGEVSTLNLANNNLNGDPGNALAVLKTATTINVAGNFLTALPDLASLTALTSLNVSNNNLSFEDLEPNAGVAGIVYSPQRPFGTGASLSLIVGDTLTIFFDVPGTMNQYQWQRNTVDQAGQIADSLKKTVTLADNGFWRLKITNTLVPGLDLFTNNVNVKVIYLVDSLALVQFYTATNGPGWTTRTNWLTGNLSGWYGVSSTQGEVTAINLPNNNIQGNPGTSLTALKYVTAINLSGNELTTLPDLTIIPTLTTIDVSDNKLEFASLEPNASLLNIDYSDQAPIGTADTKTLRIDDGHQISVTTSGANNQYQWKRDNAAIGGATSSVYQIPKLTKVHQGTYTCDITNTVVPGLTISSAPETVILVADISGTLFTTVGNAASTGTVTLFRVTESGGYDTIDDVTAGANGFYKFENLLLDRYQVLAQGNKLTPPKALPTYYPSTLYWEEADTLFLDSMLTNIDIVSQLEPTDAPSGHGLIAGFVEEEVDEGGRVQVPKRVGKSGVSVRRVENTGRGKDEILTLVAYTQTNDDGEFELPNLPAALYRINVQYPGYPMDATSSIDITIGNGLQGEKHVAATVAEGVISVRELVITGSLREGYRAEIYPNPTRSAATIRFPNISEHREVVIYDMKGQRVLVQTANHAEVLLDVSSLAQGLYLLAIEEKHKNVKTLRLDIR